jgi:N-methylhydantoinase B
MSTRTIDPVTLEVVRNKLDGIANEMEMTLLHSSFSSLAKESMDASASLFSIEGDTLAQAAAIPIHLATLIPVVARMLAEFPLSTMRPGDYYILNDPYCGGTHLPDLAIVAPVFFAGEVIALSAVMTHHQDVGGMTPGSVPTNATEIFQEGLRVPPLQLLSAAGWNETLVKILRQNSRTPDALMGDVNAQVAACTLGARRIVELAEKLGALELIDIFRALLDRSETLTRRAIAALPQGTFHYVDHLDNDGIELDRRVRIEVAVTVAGDRIVFDFTGTSPQVKGPINCVPSGALAAACFAVRALTDPTIPTNGGCFRPLELIVPEGTLMNPREPAPVGTRTSTIKMAAACIISALRQAMPERLPASDAVLMYGLAWGTTLADGRHVVFGESIGAGSGASRERDGIDAIETDVTNCMNLPVEAVELDCPLRVNRSELRTDSGGDGEFRGGLGIVREYEVLEGSWVLTHRGERFYSSAPGLAGGEAGAPSRGVVIRADGSEEPIPSKRVCELRAGDRLVIESAGGGGYGDRHRRPMSAVRSDVEDRKISRAHARAAYGYDG